MDLGLVWFDWIGFLTTMSQVWTGFFPFFFFFQREIFVPGNFFFPIPFPFVPLVDPLPRIGSS